MLIKEKLKPAHTRRTKNTQGKPKCAQKGAKNMPRKNGNTQKKIKCAQRTPSNMPRKN